MVGFDNRYEVKRCSSAWQMDWHLRRYRMGACQSAIDCNGGKTNITESMLASGEESNFALAVDKLRGWVLRQLNSALGLLIAVCMPTHLGVGDHHRMAKTGNSFMQTHNLSLGRSKGRVSD